MPQRPSFASMALVAIAAALPVLGALPALPSALRPGTHDPNSSLVVNHSSEPYQIRISDKLFPAGVIKIYEEEDKEMKTPLKEFQKAGESFIIEAGKTVKMVVCPSPKAGNLIVMLHLSLDRMEGSSVKNKNLSRVHFVHGQMNKMLVNAAKAAQKLKLPSDLAAKIKAYTSLEPVSIDNHDPEPSPEEIKLEPGNYQKAYEGLALWTIEK